jgi:hypothetical protein
LNGIVYCDEIYGEEVGTKLGGIRESLVSDQEPTTIRIGEILERAGLVTPGDLSEAVSVSKRLAMPIGRILIMSGCVTEGLLKAALDAQTMLRERLISVDTAIETLVKVAEEKISFQQALERTDPQHLAGSTTSKLGEILIEFGLLDETLLRQATVRSLETGMPLGTTLVTMNLLSPALLPAVLRASDQIRSGEVEREVAIAEFRSSYDMWVKAKESFKQGGSDSELQTAQGEGRASNAQVTSSGPHAAQEEYFRRMAAMGHPGAYQPLPYPSMPPAYPPQYAPAPPPYGQTGFPGNPADWAVSGAPGYSPAPQWPSYPQPQGSNWQQAYPPQPAPNGYMQPPSSPPAWAPPQQAPTQPQHQPQPQTQPPPPQGPANNGTANGYPFPGVRPNAAPFAQPQNEQSNPAWQGHQPQAPHYEAAPQQHPAQNSGASHNGFDQSANVVNYNGTQPASPPPNGGYPGASKPSPQPQQMSGQHQALPQFGAAPQAFAPGYPPNYSSPSHNGLGGAPNVVDPNVVAPPAEQHFPSSLADTPSHPFSPVTGPLQLTAGPAKTEVPPPVIASTSSAKPSPAETPTSESAEVKSSSAVRAESFTAAPPIPSESSTRSEDRLPAFERVISRQMKTQPPVTEVTAPKSSKKKRSGDKTTTRKALSIKTEDNEIIETESGEFPTTPPPAKPRASHFKMPSSISSISGEYRQLGSNPFSLAPVKPGTGEHNVLPSSDSKVTPLGKAEESSETISKLSDHMLESKQTFFDWGPAEPIPSSIFPRDESIEKTLTASELDQQPPTVLTWGPQPDIASAEVNIPSSESSSEQSTKTTDFDSGLSISVAPFDPQQNTDSATTSSASTSIAPPETIVPDSGNNATLSVAEPSQGSFNLSSPSVLGNKPDIYPDMTHAAPELKTCSVDLSATAADARGLKMPLTRGLSNTLVGVETQADLPSIDGSNESAIEARATLSFKVESDYVSSGNPIDPATTVPDLPVVTVTAIGAVALTIQDRNALLEKVSDAAIKNWQIHTPHLEPLEIGELEVSVSPVSSPESTSSENRTDETLSASESVEQKSELFEFPTAPSEEAVLAEPVVTESVPVIESVIEISTSFVSASAGEATFTDLKPIELPPIELPPIEVEALVDLPEDLVADISDLRNELLSEFSKLIDIQEGKKHSRLANSKTDVESEPTSEERAKNRREKKGKKAAKNGKPAKEELEAEIEQAVEVLHKQLEELPLELVVEEASDEPTVKTAKARNKSKKANKSEARKSVHHEPIDLIDVFKTAGFFSQNDLNSAFNNAIQDPAMQATLLNALGILNSQLIEYGVRCQTMLANGELKPQQVSFLLGVVRNGKSFDEALHDLGLSAAAAV